MKDNTKIAVGLSVFYGQLSKVELALCVLGSRWVKCDDFCLVNIFPLCVGSCFVVFLVFC